MNYRKSDGDDCQAIYHLICMLEEFEFDYDKFKKIYAGQQKGENYYCLVCEADGLVAGFLNMRFEDQLHHVARIGEILEFLILPEYRSMGIGKEMLALAETIAREHGCSEIELDTNQKRAAAHRFYSREGMINTHFKFTKKL